MLYLVVKERIIHQTKKKNVEIDVVEPPVQWSVRHQKKEKKKKKKVLFSPTLKLSLVGQANALGPEH